MDNELIKTIANIIGQIGIPAALAAYLLYKDYRQSDRQSTALAQLAATRKEELESNKDKIDLLKEISDKQEACESVINEMAKSVEKVKTIMEIKGGA